MNRKAMTLVELMLAMGISVAVIFGTTQLLDQFKNTEAYFEERMETNLSISNFIDTFIKQLNHSSVMINNSIFTYNTRHLSFQDEVNDDIKLVNNGDTFAVLFYDSVSQVSSDAENVRELTALYQERAICVDELKKIGPDDCSSSSTIDEWDQSRCKCIERKDSEINSRSVGLNNVKTLKVMNTGSYSENDLILITTIDSNTNAGLYSVTKVDAANHSIDVEIVDSVPQGFNVTMNPRSNLGLPELIVTALENTDQAILWAYRVALMQYEVEEDSNTGRNNIRRKRLMAKRWKKYSDTDFTSQQYISNNIAIITIRGRFDKEDRIAEDEVRENEIGTFTGAVTASIFEANTNNQNVRVFGSDIYFQNKGVERLNLLANTTISPYEIIEPSVNVGIEPIRAVRCCSVPIPTDVTKKRAFDYTGRSSDIRVFPENTNNCNSPNPLYCGPDAKYLEHYFKLNLVIAGKADINNVKYSPVVSFKVSPNNNDIRIYCWQDKYDTAGEINLLDPKDGIEVRGSYSNFYQDPTKTYYGETVDGINMSIVSAICKIENTNSLRTISLGLQRDVDVEVVGNLTFYNGTTGREATIPFASSKFKIYSDQTPSGKSRYKIKSFVPPSKFCDRKTGAYNYYPHTYENKASKSLAVFGYEFESTGSVHKPKNIYPSSFFAQQGVPNASSLGECSN